MKTFAIALILIVWLCLTAVFVISIIGLFLFCIDEGEWLNLGHKLIDKLIQ